MSLVQTLVACTRHRTVPVGRILDSLHAALYSLFNRLAEVVDIAVFFDYASRYRLQDGDFLADTVRSSIWSHGTGAHRQFIRKMIYVLVSHTRLCRHI